MNRRTPAPRAGRLFLFWTAALALFELTLQCAVYGALTPRLLYGLFFTLSSALVLTLLSSLFPRPGVNRAVRYALLALLFLLYGAQLVYFRIFGTFFSLSYIAMGGEAIGGFFPTLLRALAQSWLPLALFVLPFPALFALHRLGFLSSTRLSRSGVRLLAIGAVLLYCAGMLPVWASGDVELPGSLYRDPYGVIDRQCERFGLLTAERLELSRLLRGGAGLSGADMDLTAGDEPEGDNPGEIAANRNILPELDLAGLDYLTEDETLLALNDYFSSLSGTARNEYTGIFEGYNLIEVCAESFTPYLIDEELTPTLYRLTHEGFVFENFYNSFPSMTTNGEYSLCMGLMPDMSRVSFASSVTNYLPFCLGNRFRALGLDPKAYHNNIATFYNRINTHPNMGYDFKAIDFGLDMEKGWPASDLEMMEKTVDEYIHEDQFVVHYMTYSGHCDYNFEDNEMSIKNRARVEALDMPEELRAFYACQLELEDAMAYLVGRLEEAGIAGRTVIVLTGDHYPYGLSYENFRQLAGDAADDSPFWRYRNCFACWTGSMADPITVDGYCCTQDILPTILNLFGVRYDSRLLTGIDVLSDSAHVAILQDGSFLTEALTYNAATGELDWKQPEESFPSGYAQELIRSVKNEFSVSASILRSDYYRFAFTSLGLADPQAKQEHHYSYADIEGTWYADDVETLTICGVLTGSKGSFSGGDPTGRADYIVMLARALELEVSPDGEDPPFEDVPPTAWYYDSLAAAWNAGILEPDLSFRARDNLTMDEALAMLAAAARVAGIADPEAWTTSVYESALERAGDSEAEYPSRGFAAALIAPLALAAVDD